VVIQVPELVFAAHQIEKSAQNRQWKSGNKQTMMTPFTTKISGSPGTDLIVGLVTVSFGYDDGEAQGELGAVADEGWVTLKAQNDVGQTDASAVGHPCWNIEYAID
jgi:hypothetical protein